MVRAMRSVEGLSDLSTISAGAALRPVLPLAAGGGTIEINILSSEVDKNRDSSSYWRTGGTRICMSLVSCIGEWVRKSFLVAVIWMNQVLG